MECGNNVGGETVKRQHYVYRKHLAPWTVTKKTDGQIFCYKTDEGRIFSSNLTGVAQERYFNEFKVLTELEKFVAYFTSRTNDFEGVGNDLFMTAIGSLSFISNINGNEEYIRNNTSESKGIDFFDKVRRQLGEKAQGFYEDYGLNYLLRLLEGDVSFFEREYDRVRFTCYLMVQYSRTKKHRIKFREEFGLSHEKLRFLIKKHGHELALVHISFNIDLALEQLNDIDINLNLEKVHPYVLDGLALFVVKKMLARRKPEIQLINAQDGCEFFTGDQPVVNLGGLTREPAFFCPISPNKAIVLSFDRVERNEFANEQEVLVYNNMMIENAGLYVFSTSKENLEQGMDKYSSMSEARG